MANTKREKDDGPKSVMPARMTVAEARRNTHHFEIESGHTPQDLLETSYWAHVCRALKEGDLIQAKAEDGSWWAEFLVQDSGANWAKIACLRAHKLEAQAPEDRGALLAGHSVQWKGTFTKWCVVRDADNKTLFEKLASKSAAYAKLAEYSQTASTANRAA